MMGGPNIAVINEKKRYIQNSGQEASWKVVTERLRRRWGGDVREVA
jgi:hypothetical protein